MTQSGDSIVVINTVACAALTTQTESKCLLVEQQQMCSLSDGVDYRSVWKAAWRERERALRDVSSTVPCESIRPP